MSSLNPGNWPTLGAHRPWCDRTHRSRPQCVAAIGSIPHLLATVVIVAIPGGPVDVGLDINGQVATMDRGDAAVLERLIHKARQVAGAES